jgi:apoptosis-inducing factor 2
VSKDDGILKGFLGDKVANNALNELKKNHVKVVVNATIDAVKTLESGQTELTLSNGSKMITDCYIPCVGLSPNSSFMPKTLLNAKSEIMVDEYMQVKGAKDIWSCGDVADIEANKVFHIASQAPMCAANIQASLTSNPKTPYKPSNKPMGAVTVGRAKGFGAFGSWSLPGFLIYHMKVKSMMVEKLAKALAGTM